MAFLFGIRRILSTDGVENAIEHGEPCGMRRWPRKGGGRPWRVVARAMSEGALTASSAQCLAAADEVWVPTAWHVDAFVRGGVPRAALHVVPEPVDTTFFDFGSARKNQPFVLSSK